MNTFKPISSASVAFESSTLIVSIVSLGNVAQLSLDLVISTLDFKLVGALSPRHHVPVVAALESDGNEGGFMTPVEGELPNYSRLIIGLRGVLYAQSIRTPPVP